MQFDDYLQICNLIGTYSHLMDQGRHKEVSELLAHADYHSGGNVYRRDPEAITAMLDKWHKVYEDTGTLRTRHVTTNLILDDDGLDAAKSQVYVVVFQAAPGFPLQPIIAGTWLDKFEKVAGKWRFRERREEATRFELLGDLSHHLAASYDPQIG
jgi:hypothetical protein